MQQSVRIALSTTELHHARTGQLWWAFIGTRASAQGPVGAANRRTEATTGQQGTDMVRAGHTQAHSTSHALLCCENLQPHPSDACPAVPANAGHAAACPTGPGLGGSKVRQGVEQLNQRLWCVANLACWFILGPDKVSLGLT